MSREDIVHAHSDITSMFSVGSLEFLKKRAKQVSSGGTNSGSAPSSVEETNKPAKEVKVPIKVDPNWVHMDVVEPEKLEWMSDIPDHTPSDGGVRQYQACLLCFLVKYNTIYANRSDLIFKVE